MLEPNRGHVMQKDYLCLPPSPSFRSEFLHFYTSSPRAPGTYFDSPCEDFVDAWIAAEEGVACFSSRGLWSLYLLELSAAPAQAMRL